MARFAMIFVLVFAFAFASAPAAANEAASDYRIDEVTVDEPRTWVAEDDRFRPGEKMPAAKLKGARVLQVSGKGYLLVEVESQGVWVDKMDVVVTPQLPVNAGCVNLVSSASDTTAHIVRGAGEGCK